MSKGSWRERPTGTWATRLWRPWENLNPFKGRGRQINEARGIGLKDLINFPDEQKVRPERRWYVIGGFFALLLILVIYRLFMLQIMNVNSSIQTVNANSFQVSVIPATRGLIVDRNGHAMVSNQIAVEVRLSRAESYLHPSTIGALAALTGTPVKTITAELASLQYGPFQPVPLIANATGAELEFIKLHPNEFPGVSVLNVAVRTYPLGGDTGAQVLGYVGPITGGEIAANPHSGYHQNSLYGKTGVENFYENFLKGEDGVQTLKVSATGKILGTAHTKRGRVGDSLVLNIDAALQAKVDALLVAGIKSDRLTYDPTSHIHPPAINGAAVVLDPNTGAVLAMSSYPSYNLQNFVTGLSNTQFKTLLQNGSFNDYAIQGTYTPGSTFKMITATAALQNQVISPTVFINDSGTFKVPNCLQGGHGCYFHDNNLKGAGLVDMALALTKSSDYYFYNLGYLFWDHSNKYGKTPIQDVAAQYGIGNVTNIDLSNEAPSRVDSPTVRISLHAQAPLAFPNVDWYTGDNVEMAFGQGTTAISPIGMATAYATLANGGTRYTPEVAAAVIDPHGKVVARYLPRAAAHVNLPPSVRDPIVKGLLGVINNPVGTAYGTFHATANFDLTKFLIAGKSGTASNSPGQEPNSWFVGFGPNPHPKYVVLAVIGQGGYGAEGGAPIVAQIFNYLVAHPIKPVTLKRNLTGTTAGKPQGTTTTTKKAS
jgi:penicillin-binding protein 2